MGSGLNREAAQLDAEWSSLMRDAQAGDKVAYQRLLRGCTPLIRRVARHQGVQGDRVDDVVQETLLTIHRARQTYDPSRSFSSWLYAIAQRRAIDGLRRHGRQDRREIHAPQNYEAHPDPSAGQETTADMKDRAVMEAVTQLPEGQRQAIEALALQQLSLDEAAIMTGKTKGALKVNMHRALTTLRARFGGDVG
jgi:RNA polymerase sigma factor (sigma-70 family)